MSDKTSRNDVTGDLLRSKPANDMFEEGWDRIFGKQKTVDPLPKETPHKILRESRIDVIGQNGNDGVHYEYELDKSTGEVIKKVDEK
jgi:hypothetical protein